MARHCRHDTLQYIRNIHISCIFYFIKAYGFNPLIQDQIKNIFGGKQVSVIRTSFDQSERTSSNNTEKLA